MNRFFPACSFMTALSFLLATCLLMSGCSSIKVIETWKNPPVSGHPYQKLMIVSMTNAENLRETSENTLVKELRGSGVLAIASHSLVKEFDNAKRDDIVAAVHQSGADAVLSIRAISKGDKRVTQGGESGSIYGTGHAAPGGRSFSLATLQTNLYDSATEKLVWSATISTDDAGDPGRVSRDLATFFLENLRQGGFL